MAEKILQISLVMLFFVPPLIFVPGKLDGQWVFMNYREPKLAAVQILSWLFLTVFWWTVWDRQERIERLKQVLHDKLTWFFICFFIYLCWTATHAVVIDASLYELAQYFTIINLFIAFSVIWQEERMMFLYLLAVLASFVVVTLIGLYQLHTSIPWLIPIADRLAAHNPSTMGYKNPAAQAVLGQFFLVSALLTMAARYRKWILVGAGCMLLLAEAFYLATLQSRTSYFAFAVTFICMAVMLTGLFTGNSRDNLLKTAVPVMVLVAVIFSVTVAKYPPAHRRIGMMMVYFRAPAKFFESDRGIYLRNSIYMAEKNFFGVGIGNWGFAYPVYRHCRPKFLFNKRVQVRRAHGDYAQMLGETGFPGLLLFLILTGWLFIRGFKVFLNFRNPFDLFILAQVLAFMCIMLFDYCIEMPYHKFAFFSVLALVNARFSGSHL